MPSRFSKTLFVTISSLALGMTALSGAAAAQGNELITKDSFAGDPLQWDSFDPSVSADGNVTAFVSYASELVPGGIGGFSYI